MRAWLLLLAVLATFKPIVQVASTEDTTSTTFLKAITPQEQDFYNIINSSDFELELVRASTTTITTTKTTTTSPKTSSSATITTATTQQAKSSNTKTSSKSTALVKAFNLKTVFVDMTTMSPVATEKSTKTMKKQKFSKLHENSDNEILTNDRLSSTPEVSNTQEHQHKHHHHNHHDNTQHHKHHHHHHHHHQQHQDSTMSTTTASTSKSTSATSLEPKANLADSTSNIFIQNSDISSPALAITTTSSLSSPSKSSKTSTITSTASTDDELLTEEPATFSNKELIKEKAKPDPEVLVEIENSLLSLFNMKRPPKIDRSKIIIPDAMKKLYEEIMKQELISVNLPKPGLLTKSANTVRSFTHQDSKIDHRFPHHHRFRLYFDIKSIPAKEKLKAAEVQLTRDAINHQLLKPVHANRTVYQVLAYDITRLGIRGQREPTYLLLDNKYVRLNSTETISIDVQPAVERWLATPKQNFGLLIEVRTMRSLKPAPHHHVRLRRSVDETHDEWQRKQPLLFTYTDDGRHKQRSIRDVSTRSKRAEHHQHRRGRRRKTNEDCRRHSLYVDFADVGWSDWIVAPPGYDAYYCHGKCPSGLFEHLNTTNHAVVQTLVNNLNPAKVPKPCCVPTELEGMSMLYLNDQNTVVLKSYQDMTVVGCGCR